jgi:beta-lactamase regulating signal transducer with metallopeptidase domain
MLGWTVETTLVASGLAIVALLAGRVRTVGPAARHALWLAVLIKLVMPPLVAWPWASPAIIPNLEGLLADTKRATDGFWSAGQISLEAGGHEVVGEGEGRRPAIIAVAWDAEPVGNKAFAGQDRASPVGPAMISGGTEQEWFRALPGTDVAMMVIGGAWVSLSLAMASGQMIRVIRFRRRLRSGVPAPFELIEEAERIASWLGVRAPRILVVEGLGTPLLWCLGRTQLLLPAELVETLARDRWPAILTHELAHLKRGDHWVSRLELAAGLVWWWNPVYWLTKRRLDAEAELACDAWVVQSLPKDRLAYAEILFDLSANFARACSPEPMLGIAGTGRFLERRLMMILHGDTSHRPSRLGLLVVALLFLFAVPSWTGSGIRSVASAATLVVTGDANEADEADDFDDDDDDDADDDDKDEVKSPSKDKAPKRKAEIRVKGTSSSKDKKPGLEIEVELKNLGESFAKDVTAIFGSQAEFQAQMKAFGEDIARSQGDESEVSKKMEAFGKLMEKRFGKDSELEAKMEAFGKTVEKKLGEGSEFAKKMEAFGKEMEKRFGDGPGAAKPVGSRERMVVLSRAGAGGRSTMTIGKGDLEKLSAELKSLEAREAWAESVAEWATLILKKGRLTGDGAKTGAEELYFNLAGEGIDRKKAELQKAKADQELGKARAAVAQARKKLVEAKNSAAREAKAAADTAYGQTLELTAKLPIANLNETPADRTKNVAKSATGDRGRAVVIDRTDKRIAELEAQVNALRKELKALAETAKSKKGE